VVSFTPRPLYPQGKRPSYPLGRRLGGPQSRLGHSGEDKNSQPIVIIIIIIIIIIIVVVVVVVISYHTFPSPWYFSS
jgi:hypothetical protein